MATTLNSIIYQARKVLLEDTPSFWTDAELLDIALNGCRDLWKGIIDVYQDHFLTLDESNVSLAANATTASGVPSDLFRVKFIEPRDRSTYINTFFFPRDYASDEFRRARTLTGQDATGCIFFYDVVGAGPPVAAPSLYISPKTNAALNLAVGYIAGISSSLTTASNNPIPGETDNALKAWTIAWARAKDREDRSPDPEWLKVYGDEKLGIITAVTPRQEDEPDYVEGLFDGYEF
jgi:hypothetical protein